MSGTSHVETIICWAIATALGGIAGLLGDVALMLLLATLHPALGAAWMGAAVGGGLALGPSFPWASRWIPAGLLGGTAGLSVGLLLAPPWQLWQGGSPRGRRIRGMRRPYRFWEQPAHGSWAAVPLGWRATFWSLVLMGLVTLVGLLVMLPRRARSAHAGQGEHAAHASHVEHTAHTSQGGQGAHAAHAPASHGAHSVAAADLEGLDAHALAHLGGAGQAAPLGQQLTALRRPAVWLSLLMTLLSYGGVFTSYVYLAPQLTEVSGFDAASVTPLFLLFGVGLFIGNSIGGRLADRYGIAAVVATVAALVLALFGMTWAIQSQATAIVGLLLYGVAAFAVVAPLQLRVMAEAGDAPDIASAANISAFTLGSALGIWLGGWAIDAGLGLASVNWVGGLISLSGLALALISWRWLDRGQASGHAGHHPAQHAGHHA